VLLLSYWAHKYPNRFWQFGKYPKICPWDNYNRTAKVKEGLYVGLAYLHRLSNLDIKVVGDLSNLNYSYRLDFKGINVSSGLEHHISNLSIGISAQFAMLSAKTTHATQDSPNLALIPVQEIDIFGQKYAFRFEPNYLLSIGINF
jgi:hypothetical protein